MASSETERRASSRLPRRERSASTSTSLEFFVFEDFGGGYHWAIVGGSGESLAQSESFGSYAEAAHAGCHVRDSAESARFQRRAAEDRVVGASDRREAAVSDDLDVARWLDERGSFKS
jgi:uncharacterized protein YegP (UPF0339 family)